MDSDDVLRPMSSEQMTGASAAATAAACEMAPSIAMARQSLGKVPRKGILKKKHSTDTSFDQNASFDNTPMYV